MSLVTKRSVNIGYDSVDDARAMISRRQPFPRAGSTEQIFEPALGKLELDIMRLVWAADGEVAVRDVHEQLGGGRAYTTLMTTMDRLHRKGLLLRRKVGRAFAYKAATTAADLGQQIAAELLSGLLTQTRNPEGMLAAIVEAVWKVNASLVSDLEQIVSEKRRRLPGHL
jgi:BlaI family transcriptional regulator, penicillinase repressor